MFSKKLKPGDTVDTRRLVAVSGERVDVPDARDLVHLQFRRFAGCPVCNLHLRSIAQRHDAIEAAGIREVVVFHSSAEALLPHVRDLPFAVIADPEKRLYREFGVEPALRSLFDPRAWLPIARGIVLSSWNVIRGKHPLPPVNPEGGRFGSPADFLFDAGGRVLDCSYGTHVYDQWSADELLAKGAQARAKPRTSSSTFRREALRSDTF